MTTRVTGQMGFDPARPLVVHHSRGSGERILTRAVTQGAIELDPPGLEVTLAGIYAAWPWPDPGYLAAASIPMYAVGSADSKSLWRGPPEQGT